MMNVGGWELLVILLVALVFLGPEKLPGAARQIGQTVSTLRGLARSFQSELEAAARPTPLKAAPAPAPSDTEPGSDPFAGKTNTVELAAKARELSVDHDDATMPENATVEPSEAAVDDV